MASLFIWYLQKIKSNKSQKLYFIIKFQSIYW